RPGRGSPKAGNRPLHGGPVSHGGSPTAAARLALACTPTAGPLRRGRGGWRWRRRGAAHRSTPGRDAEARRLSPRCEPIRRPPKGSVGEVPVGGGAAVPLGVFGEVAMGADRDRKSTRLNSSHVKTSY